MNYSELLAKAITEHFGKNYVSMSAVIPNEYIEDDQYGILHRFFPTTGQLRLADTLLHDVSDEQEVNGQWWATESQCKRQRIRERGYA